MGFGGFINLMKVIFFLKVYDKFRMRCLHLVLSFLLRLEETYLPNSMYELLELTIPFAYQKHVFERWWQSTLE